MGVHRVAAHKVGATREAALTRQEAADVAPKETATGLALTESTVLAAQVHPVRAAPTRRARLAVPNHAV